MLQCYNVPNQPRIEVNAPFSCPGLLSASSSMGNQAKRGRRQEGGSNRAGGNKHGRGGVMRELALTCQGCVPPTIPYNAMLALYESLAMFRNLPLASGSQLFQLFVSTYFWFRRCYHLFWVLGSGNIVLGTFSAKMWFANNVNLQLKTVLRLMLTSYFHDDPPLIPT